MTCSDAKKKLVEKEVQIFKSRLFYLFYYFVKTYFPFFPLENKFAIKPDFVCFIFVLYLSSVL